MSSTICNLLLACGFVLVAGILAPRVATSRLPGDHSGYAPDQPIAYSHRLHAGELGIACLYCHSGAERSRHAGIPSASLCMNCHTSVSAPVLEVRAEDARATAAGRPPARIVSPELAKLYRSIDDRDPIRWTKVHHLPDFAFFDHRSHVTAGVSCQRCHGPVETMERMRQQSTLTMGWCVDCHRTERATLDCSACHR